MEDIKLKELIEYFERIYSNNIEINIPEINDKVGFSRETKHLMMFKLVMPFRKELIQYKSTLTLTDQDDKIVNETINKFVVKLFEYVNNFHGNIKA